MTLFKTALLNLKRSPVMNAIALLQLIAVFLAAAVMSSTMSIRLRSYEPIKDILERRGFHADFDLLYGAGQTDEYDVSGIIRSVEELNSYADAEQVIYIRSAALTMLGTDPELRGYSPTVLFYDDEIIRRYRPALKSGRWLNENADTLELVITDDNAQGWKLGDTLDLEVVQTASTSWIKATVVGIVESDTDILGYNRSRIIANDTFRYLYDTHNSRYDERPQTPTMLSSAKAVERLFPEIETIIHSAFFTYGDDVSDEFIKEKSKAIGQQSGRVIINLDTMNSNSKTYLRDETLKLLPIVAVLMILVIVSSVSVSAIAARRRLKDYAKYYMLGLRWGQCAAVNLFQALITGVTATVISAAAMFAVKYTKPSGFITIIINPGLIFSLLGVLALYLAFSMIMPLLMLRSTTPKELLQTE